MIEFVKKVVEHTDIILLMIILILCSFLITECSRLEQQIKRNDLLEQDYKSLFKSDSLKTKELYVVYAERDRLLMERPELERQIDSLEHTGKVFVDKVEVETIKYRTDTILLQTNKTPIDTVVKDNCIWTYIAMSDSLLSLTTEISGKLYLYHTTEKELLNPSKSKIVNFFRKIFGKAKEFNKVRIVDECGLLKDMEVIELFEK